MGDNDTTGAIDLDDLVPADKPVKFAGREFRLPGDMPLVTYLQMNRLSSAQEGEDLDEIQLLNDMVGSMVDLFLWNVTENVEDTRAFLRTQLERRGMGMITNMLGRIYPMEEPAQAGDDGAVDADAATPPTATDGQTITTSS